MLAFAIARLRGFVGSRGVASRTEIGPIGPLEHHARRVDGACMLEEAVSGEIDRGRESVRPVDRGESVLGEGHGELSLPENPAPDQSAPMEPPGLPASYSRLGAALRGAPSTGQLE